MTQPPSYGPPPHGVPAPPPAPTSTPGGYPPPGPYAQAPGPYAPAPSPYAPGPGYPPQQPPPGYPVQGQAGYPGQPPAGYPGQAPGGYPPPGYEPSPYAGQQVEYVAAPPPPHAGLVCRFCGGFPAVEATVRGHQGLVIMMRFLSLKGPFCRLCGIAVHREMTSRTMWQGWWGWASFVITPFTLLYNLVPRSRFSKLPMPSPGFRPPSDPGRPLFLRPGTLGVLFPALIVAAIVISNLQR